MDLFKKSNSILNYKMEKYIVDKSTKRDKFQEE